MKVSFKCGHASVTLERSVSESPRCPQCGERVVTRVSDATPVFKGACKGPLVKA
jgi:predicted RNA-binding Zn-ribbon protein involved in translation (DUF1610 family)